MHGDLLRVVQQIDLIDDVEHLATREGVYLAEPTVTKVAGRARRSVQVGAGDVIVVEQAHLIDAVDRDGLGVVAVGISSRRRRARLRRRGPWPRR